MNSENPYEPPRVEKALSDFDPQPVPEKMSLKSTLFSFEGRIPRRVYWAVSLGVMFVFYAIIFSLLMVFGEESPVVETTILVLYIPLIWISLAVQAKRWHDRNKSGRWILIGFIPLIGTIWVLIENGFLRATRGPNRYGPDPT